MNKLKLLKGLGLGLSIAGMVVTAIVGDKENKLNLQKMVNEKLNK